MGVSREQLHSLARPGYPAQTIIGDSLDRLGEEPNRSFNQQVMKGLNLKDLIIALGLACDEITSKHRSL